MQRHRHQESIRFLNAVEAEVPAGEMVHVILDKWVKDFAADPQHAFPGQGQMKPEQLEIERLRREVTKLKAERDILRKAAAYFAREAI